VRRRPASADGPRRLEAAPAPARSRRRRPPRRGFSAIWRRARAVAAPAPGEELTLRFANRLEVGTTLSFPGLRTANAVAGIGGLTQPSSRPGRSRHSLHAPDSGFNLYLPTPVRHRKQIGSGLFGPILVEEASPPAADWSDRRPRGLAARRRGRIQDDFADAALARGAGRFGALVTANARRRR